MRWILNGNNIELQWFTPLVEDIVIGDVHKGLDNNGNTNSKRD